MLLGLLDLLLVYATDWLGGHRVTAVVEGSLGWPRDVRFLLLLEVDSTLALFCLIRGVNL